MLVQYINAIKNSDNGGKLNDFKYGPISNSIIYELNDSDNTLTVEDEVFHQRLFDKYGMIYNFPLEENFGITGGLENIKMLIIPKGVTAVHLNGLTNLKHLYMPPGCKELSLNSCGITTLIVPNECDKIDLKNMSNLHTLVCYYTTDTDINIEECNKLNVIKFSESGGGVFEQFKFTSLRGN